jgi:hypothetical protein
VFSVGKRASTLLILRCQHKIRLLMGLRRSWYSVDLTNGRTTAYSEALKIMARREETNETHEKFE